MNNDIPSRAWYVLTLAVAPDEAELLAERIREQFQLEPVQLDRPGGAHTWLELYFEREEALQPVAERIRATIPVAGIAVRRCDSRDWQAFWQLHFKAQPVGKRLLICPAWEESAGADTVRHTLRIVPGLSFGTGDHFTTRFCLETIDQLAPPGPCRTLWDVGCGSGILAVAGALLGMERVLGTDNDPVCLTQSAENAALNGVDRVTSWRKADMGEGAGGAGPFDLVCANLYAALLIDAAPVLWEAAARYLVVSGVRESEADAVAESLVSLGAREIVRDGDGAWAGLLFQRT